MDKITTLSVWVKDAQTNSPIAGLTIEAWDYDCILVDDFMDKGVTDENGLCKLVLDPSRFAEYFLDRHPDVYFKIYRDHQLIHNTGNSPLCNLRPGEHEHIILLSADQQNPPGGGDRDDDETYTPSTGEYRITGVAVAPADWGN